MRDYTLNMEAAKAAGTSQRITETGRYVGRFTRAQSVVSRQKSSEGIEFTFEADDGRAADYLTVWTHDVDGKELAGFKMLNALMTCMKLREIKATKSKVERDGKSEEAFVYPALLQKIGLLLQRETYEKTTGGEGFKFNIVLPFAHDTGLTALEILERKTTPEQADKIAATLADRAPRRKPGAGGSGRGNGDPGPSYDGGAGIPDDDVPF